MLPTQSYEPAEWWEAHLKQWAWSLHTWNPGQQTESIQEVRDSHRSNLHITFSASVQVEAGQPDSARGLDLLVGVELEIPPMVSPSTSSAPSTQGDRKPQNINPDMQGVQDRVATWMC